MGALLLSSSFFAYPIRKLCLARRLRVGACLLLQGSFRFAGLECCVASPIEQIAILIGQIEARRKLQVAIASRLRADSMIAAW